MSPARTLATGRILVVDDDRALLASFKTCLTDAGHYVAIADNVGEALRLAARQPFDVCLLDRAIGAESGVEALPKFKQLAPDLRVVMITAHGAVDSAMEALGAGADDYLVKPCSPDQIKIACMRHIEAKRLAARVEALERELPSVDEQLESESPAMQQVLRTARDVAGTDANVLILGESGTGKGVLARAIHGWSARASGEFITINCPSLSADLLESELFGHARGSFTGASHNTAGRVSQADAGTLFLDEIGDFPLSLQPKLLRFIQDKEYERVGDPVTRRADVRIVSATNRDVDEMASNGQFRRDLLYRLNVISLHIPPLRARGEDVQRLAEHFLTRYASAYHRPARAFSTAAMAQIRAYAWPGNVRELQNVIERAAILCQGNEIEAQHLALGPQQVSDARTRVGTSISLEELERLHIEQVLKSTPTLDAASKTLGIDASTLYRKRKAYGLR